MPPHRPLLTIDLAALIANGRAIHAKAPGAILSGVVKADAYGTGVHEVSRALAEHLGVKTYFVAYADEATALLSQAPYLADATVYVLNGPAAPDTTVYADRRILPVVNSLAQGAMWQAMDGGPCAISIDIGMNRLGTSVTGAISIASIIGTQNIHHIMMHLSHSGDADAPENTEQRNRFEEHKATLASICPQATFSLAASGGAVLNLAATGDVIRAGAALYGLSPTGKPIPSLNPVVHLSAPVTAIRNIAADEAVGYNGTWRAVKPSRIAVLSVGYADGYLRSFGNRGAVWIADTVCPVVGAISMDLITADITAVEGAIEIGTHAEIYGSHIFVDDAARTAGTIGYELLTAIGSRVERRYRR